MPGTVWTYWGPGSVTGEDLYIDKESLLKINPIDYDSSHILAEIMISQNYIETMLLRCDYVYYIERPGDNAKKTLDVSWVKTGF